MAIKTEGLVGIEAGKRGNYASCPRKERGTGASLGEVLRRDSAPGGRRSNNWLVSKCLRDNAILAKLADLTLRVAQL